MCDQTKIKRNEKRFEYQNNDVISQESSQSVLSYQNKNKDTA